MKKVINVKKARRLLAVLLTLSMAVTLAACSSNLLPLKIPVTLLPLGLILLLRKMASLFRMLPLSRF